MATFADFKRDLATFVGNVKASLNTALYEFPASEMRAALGIPEPATFGEYRTKADALPYVNVRASPTTSAVILKQVYPNTAGLFLLSETYTIANGETWGYFRIGNTLGYMAMRFLVLASTPIPSNRTKTSVHLMGFLSDADLQNAANIRAVAYKATNHIQAMNYVASRVLDATLIYRRFEHSNEDPAVYIAQHGGTVEAAVDFWMADMQATFDQLPRTVYFESFNEQQAPDIYLAFETLRIKKMAAQGRRACVLNIGAGQTDEAMWIRAKPMVQAAIQYGAIVGVHGYAQTELFSCYNGSSWSSGQWNGSLFPAANPRNPTAEPHACHAFRYEQDLFYLRKMGLGAVKLALTEYGLDNMINPAGYPAEGMTDGWKTCETAWRNRAWLNGYADSAAFYRAQLQHGDTILKLEPQVVAAFVYNYGEDEKWKNWDSRSVFL